MARKLRLEYPGAICHVMNRGDRHGPIFRTDQGRGTAAAGLDGANPGGPPQRGFPKGPTGPAAAGGNDDDAGVDRPGVADGYGRLAGEPAARRSVQAPAADADKGSVNGIGI